MDDDILETFKYLYNPDDTFEVCLIGPKVKRNRLWGNEYAGGKNPVIAGWFDDIEKAAAIITQADKVLPIGCYCTLNPCNPALLARASNRLTTGVCRTKDSEIAEVRHIFVDADPIRPAGISSTDAEKKAALELLRIVYQDLQKKGWEEPLVADSGNGGHLIYQVDSDCAGLIPDFLKALNYKFSTDAVNIDTTVGNPARLVKIYGTMTRKGDSIPDRPHRIAKILNLPKKAT